LKISVLKDADAKRGDNAEGRVSATPETVKGYVAAGHMVTVVKGAGAAADFADKLYTDVGATVSASNAAAVKTADLVLSVTGGNAKLLASMKKGAGITGLMNPADHPDYIAALAKAGVTGYALEYIPRISRAQSMDVLSSQSNLAGYRSVVEAGGIYGRAMPMMMRKSKWPHWGQNSSRLKMTSSRRQKRQAAMRSKCRQTIKNYRPS